MFLSPPPCPHALDLARYALVAQATLPSPALDGASALVWRAPAGGGTGTGAGTLLVLPDSGTVMVEVTFAGQQVAQMAMTNFADPEGMTVLEDGSLALSEERLGRAYRFTYAPGGTLNRNALQSIVVGPNTGTNSGSEGIAFDPRDGSFVAIKEKNPSNVFRVTGSFATGQSTYVDLFPTAGLAVADIADVYVLAGSPATAIAGGPDADDLLLLSQASNRLMHVTRSGAVRASIDLASLGVNPEGVTMDDAGRIIVCADGTPSRLYVFAPTGGAGGGSGGCPCAADLNGDGVVDGTDLGVLLAAWGTGGVADLDGSGSVDGVDLGAMLGAWGGCG